MLVRFWQKYPALFIGIHLLCGCACALEFHYAFLIPSLSFALWFRPLYSQKIKLLLLSTLLFFAGFGMTKMRYCAFDEVPKMSHGQGIFSISSMRKTSSFFNESWVYKGTLTSFHTKEGSRLTNLPCTLFLSGNKAPPKASCNYQIEGTLIQKEKFSYLLKPTKGSSWSPIHKSFSFAHLRFLAKNALKHLLQKAPLPPKSYSFLSALITGDLEDKVLAWEFRRVGLSHLLAVSGFHFALIALIFTLFLRLFFLPKTTYSILLAISTLFFWFIGSSPSVQRAWITLSLFFLARLFQKKFSGLNTLGIALSIILCLQPIRCTEIGFQLSFLITLAILLYFPLFEKLLLPLFPKHLFKTLLTFSSFDKHCYILSALTRNVLSLNCAVHLFAIPTCLFIFQKFPLLSLPYNLFFPFCVSISLFLLLLSLVLSPLFPLANCIHYLNGSYTAFLLNLTAKPPSSFQIFLRLPHFPLSLLILLLTALFWIGFYTRENLDEDKLTDLPF
jgi:competence protein ComEC